MNSINHNFNNFDMLKRLQESNKVNEEDKGDVKAEEQAGENKGNEIKGPQGEPITADALAALEMINRGTIPGLTVKPNGSEDVQEEGVEGDRGASGNINGNLQSVAVRVPSFSDVDYSGYNNEEVTLPEYEAEQALANLRNSLKQQLVGIAHSMCNRNGIAFDSGAFDRIFDYAFTEAERFVVTSDVYDPESGSIDRFYTFTESVIAQKCTNGVEPIFLKYVENMKEGKTPEAGDLNMDEIDTREIFPEDQVVWGVYTQETIREMMYTRLRPRLLENAKIMCLEYGVPYNADAISGIFDEAYYSIENSYSFWPHLIRPWKYAEDIMDAFGPLCADWVNSQL